MRRQASHLKSSRGFLPRVDEAPAGLEEGDAELQSQVSPDSGKLGTHLPDLVKRKTRAPSDAGSTMSATGSDWSPASTANESASHSKKKDRKQKLPQVLKLSEDGRKLLTYLQEDTVKVELVSELLLENKKGGTLVNEREEVFGWHSLLFAANNGNAHLLQILLDAKADQNAADNLGNAALHVAARSDRVQAVEHLLARQADVNAANTHGWTALIWAAMNGHQQVVPRLLDAAADVNMTDDEGRTACMWASRHRHVGILQALLAVGPDLKIRDNAGLSAMDHAHECRELRETLKKVDAVNRGLLDAAKKNQTEAVRSALNAGANANASDHQGSALEWAAAHGSVEMVQVLMKHGGNAALLRASSALHRQREADVYSALQDALGVSDRFLNAARDAHWDTAFDAMRAGAWIEARDHRSFQTALIYAGVHGASHAVLELASAKANLERRDVYGWTAVHTAVHYGWTATVSTLYYAGADIFSQSYEGDFAQHLCARSDQCPMLLLLCAAAADLNAQNTMGHTAIQEAVVAGCTTAISTLVANHADTTVKDCRERNMLGLAVVQGHAVVVEALFSPSQVQKKPGKGIKDPLADPSEVEELEDAEPEHEQEADIHKSDIDKDSDADAMSVASSSTHKRKKKKTTIPKVADDDRRASTQEPDVSTIDRNSKPRKTRKTIKKKVTSLPLLEPLEPPTSEDYLLARARMLREVLPKDVPAALHAGPALSASDQDGRTALMLAVRCRHENLVPILIMRKANVDAADAHGMTALMLAAAWGEPEVLENLLLARAQALVQDKDGKTAIDHACNTRVRRQLQQYADSVAIIQRINSAPTLMPPVGRKSKKDSGTGDNTRARASRASATAETPGLLSKESPIYRLRLERLPVKLPMDMVEGQILNVLKRRGNFPPARVDVVVDPITQRPRGYAYLEYSDARKAEAVALAAHKDPHEFFGTGVRVVLEGSPSLAALERGASRGASREASRGASRGLQL